MTGAKTEPSVTGTKTERAAADARSGAVPTGVRRLVNRLLAVLVALVVWHLFALGPGASSDFPTPLESFRTAIDLAGTGAYWSNIATSVETALLGLALAVLVGLPVGLLIGANEHARRSTRCSSTSAGRFPRSRCCRCSCCSSARPASWAWS